MINIFNVKKYQDLSKVFIYWYLIRDVNYCILWMGSTNWNLYDWYSFSIQFWTFWLIIISAQFLRIIMKVIVSVSNWCCHILHRQLSRQNSSFPRLVANSMEWLMVLFYWYFSYLFVWISKIIILVYIEDRVYLYRVNLIRSTGAIIKMVRIRSLLLVYSILV